MSFRVLAACEESQAVVTAFRSFGCSAFSCDLLPTSGPFPEYHIQADVTSVLQDSWDLVIAFPPCTFLTRAGASNLFRGGVLNQSLYEAGVRAAEFFRLFLSLPCPTAVENPCPMSIFGLPPASQAVQPYMFGESYSKLTYLWLRRLPLLMATDIRPRETDFFGSRLNFGSGSVRSCNRSKTPPGLAFAMASQWLSYLGVI